MKIIWILTAFYLSPYHNEVMGIKELATFDSKIECVKAADELIKPERVVTKCSKEVINEQ